MSVPVERRAFAVANAALRADRPIRNSFLRRLNAELASKSPAASEAELRQYVSTHPKDPDGLLLLVQHLVRLGRKREVAALDDRALDLAPDAVIVRFLYADLLGQMNRVESALSELDLLISPEPVKPLFKNLN